MLKNNLVLAISFVMFTFSNFSNTEGAVCVSLYPQERLAVGGVLSSCLGSYVAGSTEGQGGL